MFASGAKAARSPFSPGTKRSSVSTVATGTASQRAAQMESLDVGDTDQLVAGSAWRLPPGGRHGQLTGVAHHEQRGRRAVAVAPVGRLDLDQLGPRLEAPGQLLIG